MNQQCLVMNDLKKFITNCNSRCGFYLQEAYNIKLNDKVARSVCPSTI